MKPSRYLEKFKRLAEDGRPAYQLIGDYLLVERIPDEEFKTKSGLIITATYADKNVNAITADRPNWVRVLAVGEGYYSQETNPDTGIIEERTVPLDVAPGDIVLVSRVAVKLFSLFGQLEGYEADTIGLTKASEIQLRFKGQEGYEQAFTCLNVASEAQVE